jgi:ABC-type transport system substrate-binding protein
VTRNFAALAAAICMGIALLTACGVPSSPHPRGSEQQNTMFTAFQERSPKHLDPTASYSNNETPVTFQVYEPLYSYHYLKRPFELIPKLAEELPQPKYLDKDGKPLPDDALAEQIAQSVYDIKLKKGVKFAPHPAFAKNDKGEYLYHNLTRAQVGNRRTPYEFEVQGTRELVADDIVYAIKRHATTRVIAPIFSVFAANIVGLEEYGELIKKEDAKLLAGLPSDSLDKPFLDFRQWPLEGATAVDTHTVRIRIKGKYPQMKYWMSMTFFAPVPWEADKFYAQPGMAFNGLTLDLWPAGTGPYMLSEYKQDKRHVLVRNPNFRGEPYPCEGMPGDKEKGLLDDCGETMPFIDKIVFDNEKESVPFRAKFAAGFLDIPEMERDDWGQQFLDEMNSSPQVNARYTERGFQFPKTTGATIWYVGFNMLDPVVGLGDTPAQQAKNRKLRQALTIAIDWNEFSLLFPRRGGIEAHSPVPPGLFGSRHGTREGMNPFTHNWVANPQDTKNGGRAVRKSMDEAKKLLAEAGYPNGRDEKTGRPLVINYDFQRALTPEFKAEVDWMAKQFNKLNVQLEIRATDFNQYQDKKRKGALQFALGGWFADYPDAENFLFLLYGPNSSAKADGDNLLNYDSPAYNKLFEKMKTLDDGPEKQNTIDQMVRILQEDAPWSFGYYPYSTGAFQPWVKNGVVPIMFRDLAKYYRLDTTMRAQKQAQWNNPTYWPLAIFIALALIVAWIARNQFRRRERTNARGQVLTAQGAE